MRDFIKKIGKIIDEISTYFMIKSCNDLKIQITNKDNLYKIEFEASGVTISKLEVEGLEESLSIPKQEDIDEYYWQLNGSDEIEREFDLIGMMIDFHLIEVQQNFFKLIIFINRH